MSYVLHTPRQPSGKVSQQEWSKNVVRKKLVENGFKNLMKELYIIVRVSAKIKQFSLHLLLHKTCCLCLSSISSHVISIGTKLFPLSWSLLSLSCAYQPIMKMPPVSIHAVVTSTNAMRALGEMEKHIVTQSKQCGAATKCGLGDVSVLKKRDEV